MAAAAVVVMVIAAAYAAYAQYQQGKAQEDAMKAEAEFQEYEGELKMVMAQREAEKHRKAVRRLMATQRAKMSASGVDITSGSPLELAMETAWEGEMDAQDIIYAGKIGQDTSNMAAKTTRFRGRMAREGAKWAATGTLATGIGGAAGYAGGMSGGGTDTTGGGGG